MVVTNRELYVRGGEHLERLYTKGQHVLDTPEAEKFVPLSNIFYVAIDEFERLMGCVEADAIRLPEFLRKVSRSNGSPEKAKQFLTDYLRAHVERWPVPHLLRDARRSSEERLREALRRPAPKQ